MSDEEWMKDWGWEYRADDYIEGSHPMDKDEVTWHHHWHKPASPSPADEDQAAKDAGNKKDSH